MTRLNEIVRLEDSKPLDQLGSYIVGATIVADNIEDFYDDYPILHDIEDAGSNLEWQGKQYEEEFWAAAKAGIAKLNEQVADQKNPKT